MTEIWDWFVNLPTWFGNVASWLVTPFKIGTLEVTPLTALGVSLGAVLAVVIALKIKSLILA